MPIFGLGVLKVNGIYRLDVKGMRWSAKRNVTQESTGAGIQMATGLVMPTGSIEEVVPKTGIFNWAALSDFSLALYDYETQKILIMKAEHCEWGNVDGSLDMAGPRTARNITWFGTVMPTV